MDPDPELDAQLRVHGDFPVAATLSRSDHEQALSLRQVDVGHVEGHRLADAQARIEGDQGEDPVPGAEAALDRTQPPGGLTRQQRPWRPLWQVEPPDVRDPKPPADVEVRDRGEHRADAAGRPTGNGLEVRSVIADRPVASVRPVRGSPSTSAVASQARYWRTREAYPRRTRRPSPGRVGLPSEEGGRLF